jgi:hypothetical protein
MPTAQAPSSLLLILDGLVAVRLVRFATHPRAREDAIARRDESGDVIAEAGDRLTAPGNFQDAADRRTRSDLLNAMASALALGAEEPGGVTWCGAHWCTAPHPGCPSARGRA